MAQSFLRNPSFERLPVILEELHTASLCIPPFQRDFEWTGEQRLALCDSVLLGLPTGSLIVWRTDHTLAAENQIGPYLLAPSPAKAPQYLLDGVQRLTALYTALAAGFWTRDGKAPPSPTPDRRAAPDGTPWSILFDLDQQEFVFDQRSEEADPNVQLFPADANRGRALLPLAVLFDNFAYDDWRGQTLLSREQANRARALRSAFMDYLIPIVPLVTNDIGVMTLTFKRVNNGGRPMGDADMIRALTWSNTFDLRHRIEAVREDLAPLGWGGLEDDALIKVIAAISKLDPTKVDAEEIAKTIRAEPSVVETAGSQVIGAIGLLSSKLGIEGPGSLPYTHILVLVARAIHDAGVPLTAEKKAHLVAWAAEACIDARFAGAPPQMIRADWRSLAQRLELPDADPPRARDGKRPKAKECWVFSMAWARSRGTALVLAAQAPRDSKDHPFPDPYALVARGSENVGMLLADGAHGIPTKWLSRVTAGKQPGAGPRSPANRVVCPPDQLPELRAALFYEACPDEILRSHLIDREAHVALLSGEFETFFERRRSAILEAERSWVETRGGQVEILREPRTYAEG
jgi:hypothetical protein